ncbi:MULTISPECIES: DUF3073 family protein [Kitasatospora]|jgi:hypothetical protein|uniref:DUF3073 family protein n=1 Tax=Kitasatospora acidiphila TaxID=2567942 RepID=A0A540W532_9ACTN|nr:MULTISPECIES: DUF3073 family protein [Kitasatospora]MDH6141411.1 hypothetical protein [Kitasatospora sp. GP30]TQF04102.1 DUF3073 family protein [Kitasatospora acidiphila]
MGRGRAKAKQTKVARELKYNSGGFDANRLSSELGVTPVVPVNPEPVDDDEDDDPYAAYADYYNDDEDEEEADAGHHQSRRRA